MKAWLLFKNIVIRNINLMINQPVVSKCNWNTKMIDIKKRIILYITRQIFIFELKYFPK